MKWVVGRLGVGSSSVLPPHLRMYAAFETLTEPHQLFATLQCVAVVGRPLLGDVHGFPEGKSHLFPLLTLTLPGIDPNDYKKTLVWICRHYPLCRV